MSSTIMSADSKGIVGWKLWYGDGSVVSSAEKSWAVAPSKGVQALVVFHERMYKIFQDDHWDQENFRDIYCGYDYYWQFGNGQSAQVPEGAEVKLGLEITQDDWRAIYNKAMQDTKWQRI